MKFTQVCSSMLLALALLVGPAVAFDDARDFTASKAKSMIKNIRKKFEKIEAGINDEKYLKKPDWFEKQITTIRKLVDKIPKKDPEWDISVETSYLDAFEAKVGPATKAYADKDYRASFDKLIGVIDEGLTQEKRLAKPSWFEGQYKGIDRFFVKVAKNEPDRDLSKEKAELEAKKKAVDTACAAYVQQQIELNEPDVVVVPAIAGVETAKAMAPDWCDSYEPDGRVYRVDYGEQASLLDERSLRAAAVVACEQPDFEKRQRWSAAWRQGVINATGLSDARVRDLYRLVLRPETELQAMKEKACEKFEGRGRMPTGMPGGPVADLAQTAFDEATSYGIGCEGSMLLMDSGDISVSDLEWWLDRQAKPESELVRAVFVLSQIGSSLSEQERAGGATMAKFASRKLGAFAFAGSDARRLDEARFRSELGKAGFNAYGTLMAEITFARAKLQGAQFATAFAALAPELKELITTVPSEGFRSWEAQAAKYKAGLANALALEQKFLDGRPGPLKGQFKKTFGFFRDYLKAEVAAKKPADLQALEDVAFGPIGYALASATVVAAAYDGQFVYAAKLYNRLERRREWRGPRWAAYWATMERFGELKAANPNMAVEQNQIAQWLHTPSPSWTQKAYEMTYNNTSGQGGGAKVKSVAVAGSGTTVTFVTEEWMQSVFDCVETNKIDRIESDGRVIYKRHCTFKGKEKRSSTEKPILVPTLLAEGISAGNLVEAFIEFNGERRATPEVVYADTEKKVITNFVGVGLR